MKVVVGDPAAQSALKHLGVIVDDRLIFKNHVAYACWKAGKAGKTVNVIARVMVNVGELKSNKRCLLASVAGSILKYGTPVWAAGLSMKHNQRLLDSWSCESRVPTDFTMSCSEQGICVSDQRRSLQNWRQAFHKERSSGLIGSTLWNTMYNVVHINIKT